MSFGNIEFLQQSTASIAVLCAGVLGLDLEAQGFRTEGLQCLLYSVVETPCAHAIHGLPCFNAAIMCNCMASCQPSNLKHNYGPADVLTCTTNACLIA